MNEKADHGKLVESSDDRGTLRRITTRLCLDIRRAFNRPVIGRLLLAAAFAAGLVIVSHVINVRVHGSDGDLAVAAPAFGLAYLILNRLTFRARARPKVERLASRWLRIRQRNPIAVDGAATVVCAVALGAFTYAIHVRLPGVGGEAVIAAAAGVISYLVVSQITNLMVGTLVRKVHSIGAAAQGAARPTILSFVDRHLERLDHQIEAILSRSGALLDVEDVKFWTEQCFAFGQGRYDGTDSHVPSDFIRLYPKYLAAHGRMLDEHAPRDVENTRILIGPHKDFRDDYIERYELGYRDFLDWHAEKDVTLLHLERERADGLRSEMGAEVANGDDPLPSVDLGIWHSQYAVLFRGEVDHDIPKVRLWMVFPGDVWYNQCEALITCMKDGKSSNGKSYPAARPLATAVPEIFERNLCRQWEQFVEPPRRMERLGPFLTAVLDRYKTGSVLDAAAGIGSDALWLAEHGFNVTLNEIEPVYRDMIEERFRANDRPLYLFGEDWRKLPSKMGQWFRAVMVLGNSLCLLGSPSQQKSAVRAFYDVLSPGGVLVIDERNFTHFTEPGVAERIRHNPIKNFPYRGDVMYCGTTVKGCPKSITPTDVVFRYYRSDAAFAEMVESADELDDAQRRLLDEREIGILHMYPFRQGELAKLLLDCGFQNITVYRDLDWATPYDFLGGAWFSKDADFFTYTATKPEDA